LIEAGDAHATHLEWLSWRRWLDTQGLPKLSPKRWLYFGYANHMTQAALTGQGVVLARTPLVAEYLNSGDLVEPLPKLRINSPMAFWLILNPRARSTVNARAEVTAFCNWLKTQAAATRSAIGEVPDSDVETGSLDD
jgi:LysR family transcriptional regulator, glycine cleavage system transcriptional activator